MKKKTQKRKKSTPKQKKRLKRIGLTVGALILLAVIVGWYFLFSAMNATGKTQYVYIDQDDNIDSVYTKVGAVSKGRCMTGFKLLAGSGKYADNIHKGRYAIDESISAYRLYQKLKVGEQTPLNVTVPSVRTLDMLAARVSKKLEMDSLTLYRALTDPAICKKFETDTANIIGLFLPETYSMNWDVTPEELIGRMKKESDKYWTEEREAQAKAQGLTPAEAVTLASIVAEETNNKEEKPTVAGLYLNRLKINMLLQADPTVKFALKNFGAKRVLNSMLTVDNPYNTYKYAGLPPGPIRNPERINIDAVLNPTKHDYLYMCAKETFDGTHNFATTMAEHQVNARRYAQALNERGIKK